MGMVLQRLVLIDCDYFEPNGSSSWKLRYPWACGSCGWTSENGCFTMDFAFREFYSGTLLGACDYAWSHLVLVMNGALIGGSVESGTMTGGNGVGLYTRSMWGLVSSDWEVGAC